MYYGTNKVSVGVHFQVQGGGVGWQHACILQSREIADVAVTKYHQRQDEIRIILPALHPKVVFKNKTKKSIMQYTPSTLNAMRFAKHIRLRACYKYGVSYTICLLGLTSRFHPVVDGVSLQ